MNCFRLFVKMETAQIAYTVSNETFVDSQTVCYMSLSLQSSIHPNSYVSELGSDNHIVLSHVF